MLRKGNMSKYNFDSVIPRRNSESVKWIRYSEEVLPLWVADMDFPTPEPIIQSIKKRLDHPFFGYGKCDPEVLSKITAWLKKRHNWEIKQEDILIMPGVVAGFNWVVHSLVEPGNAVAFLTPVYPPFYKISENTKAECSEVPMVRGESRYEIDFGILNQVICPEISLFLLCNPHNPVGRVFSRNELERVGEFCVENDLIICSDEIHSDLVFSESKHTPIASISKELAQRTVTLMAPSKTFNIPGLHFSFTVVQNECIREKLISSKLGILGNPGLLANVAAGAAYENCEDWLDELLIYLEDNRDFALEFIREEIAGISVHPPEGTYLMWLNCSELELKPSPYEFFLDRAKVALNDGKTFGSSATEFVRLNFGCPRIVLENALVRMRDAVKNR